MKLLDGIAKVFVLVMLASLPTLALADVPSAEPKQSGGESKLPGQLTNVRLPDGRGENPSAGNGNLDEIKTKLRATDEEWLVIGPKLRKVISARRVAEAGHATEVASGPRFGFFGGPPPDFPGRRPPFFGDRPGDSPGRRSRRNDRGGPPGPGPFGKDAFDDPGPPRPDGDGPDDPPRFFRPPDGGPPDDREGARVLPAPGKPVTDEKSPDGAKPSDKPQANRPTVPGGRVGPGGANRGPDFRGGPPPFGLDRSNPVARAMNDLTTTAKEATASPQLLTEKIAAVRRARQKAREKLKLVEDDLRRLITPQQEAVLIGAGYLD